MSNATSIFTFSSPLNTAAHGLAAQIDAWLVSVGSIMIVDVVSAIQENQRSGQVASVTITATNAISGGQQPRCAALLGFQGYPVGDQFAIWSANNPSAKMVRMVDLTEGIAADLDEAVIVFYSTSAVDPSARTLLVQNTSGGPVADLATSSMQVQGASGSIGVAVGVTNVSGVSWASGDLGYCSWDPTSGQWLGVLL